MVSSSSSSSLTKEKKLPLKFYGFHTFAQPGCPVSFNAVFRDNIRYFLQQCAELESYTVDGMQVWCTFLVHQTTANVIPLFTIEDKITHNSDNPFCNYCRCSGWANNFVSKRRYHFIIPVDDDWDKPLDESCLDAETHLLHGLIHCNGYGHLLTINGIEGGSKLIRGRETMDLWDRICTALQAREISVEDLSKKHMVDLRLLHGISYGRSWFNNWEYKFWLGSFGVKEHNYKWAIDILSSLELDQIINEFGHTNLAQLIIHHYRQLSEINLVTIRDLIRFMLTLKCTSPTREQITSNFSNCRFRTSTRSSLKNRENLQYAKDKPKRSRKFSILAARMDSRWPVKRLKHVAEVIVDALKEKRAKFGVHNCGLTRQEARDAARLHVGDTGLIDHVLKSMNNVTFGNYIVRRSVNHSTKLLEYSIHDLKGSEQAIPEKQIEEVNDLRHGRKVWNDMAFLFNNILLKCTKEKSLKLAVETILQSKYFVKQWPFRDFDDYSMKFICRPISISFDMNGEIPQHLWPREYVVVPLYATIGDLKLAAQNAFNDTYFVTENFFVTDVPGTEGFGDNEVLFGVLESGKEIIMTGNCLNIATDLKFEGGVEKWTVMCKCGACDDDGERMVSCDICDVWQHTKCSGINDEDSVPIFFICSFCCGSLVPVESAKCGVDLDSGSLMLPYAPELDSGLILQY